MMSTVASLLVIDKLTRMDTIVDGCISNDIIINSLSNGIFR